MPKVTIHDVAREAKVSIGTVYRAVNNTGRISDKTRQSVLEIVTRLGYKANTIARGLALRNKFTILVIVPARPIFFWDDVRKGIHRAAERLQEFGVEIIEYLYNDNSVHNKPVMELLTGQKIDAIVMSIVLYESSSDVLSFASKHGIPVAIFNQDTVSQDHRLFFYGPDNHMAGQMAAELMCKFCGPDAAFCAVYSQDDASESTVSFREQGFRDYLKKHGKDHCLAGIFSTTLGESPLVIRQIMNSHPEIKGFYMVQHSLVKNNLPLFAEKQNKYVLIGHEYHNEYAEAMNQGTITALLVQEKVCQGYYPVIMLYDYLTTGIPPERTSYYTNINILIGSNTSCLQYNRNGCGYE